MASDHSHAAPNNAHAVPPRAATAGESQVLLLQSLTIGWMVLECSVALWSAWKARSISLLVFGSDSLIELLSAFVVILQFSPLWRVSQTRAAKLCGALLYALAGAVLIIAAVGIFTRHASQTSISGIAITTGALLLMPLLARAKRRAAGQLGNKALAADAVQSATCAYLAAITLSGLLLHFLTNLRWLDPIAALAAIPIVLIEGRRARAGVTCACC